MELTTHTRGIDKTTRYGWVTKDGPGELRMLHKDLLKVHPEYQRNALPGKIKIITSEWSWISCGALVVGERDGDFWVIDGQHRALAAKRRSDISMLPCVVFQTADVKTEARGFLNINTARKAVTIFAKHKAMIAAGDEVAKYVQETCDALGVELTDTSKSPKTMKCVGWCLRRASEDRNKFHAVLELAANLCAQEDMHVPERLLDGLWYLHNNCGDGLHDRRLVKRVKEKGARILMDAATRAAAYYAHGGAKIFASGMLAELNKGLHSKFAMNGADD